MKVSSNRFVSVSLLVVASTLALSAPALGQIAPGVTMTVLPSSAPNVFGSSSWNAYLANGLNSIEHGLGTTGNPNVNPTAYAVAGPTVGFGAVTVSNFNSWYGNANPGPAFAGEYGNRMHFGLDIRSNGISQFRLNDLQFDMSSTDGGNNSFAFSGDFSGLNYGPNRYGISYGADHHKGGGDDVYFTTGNSLTFVDEIVYIGVGNALDASFEVGATNQDKLDSVFAYVSSVAPFDINCTYRIMSADGSGVLGQSTGTVTVVPTPGIVSMLGLGGLATVRRRR